MALQSADLTRLMNNARIHVPGALDDSIKLELFNTLDDFLQRTNIWREDIDFVAAPGRTSYELIGTEPGYVVSLLCSVNSAGLPVAATMEIPGTLDLAADPSHREELTATVSYTVVDPTGSDDFPQMPEGILLKYGQWILAGVIGRMMSQPAKPYTNERMGIFNLRKYGVGVAHAISATRHKNVYGGQAWCFPRFARGSQR
jgi:hypothetical protein